MMQHKPTHREGSSHEGQKKSLGLQQIRPPYSESPVTSTSAGSNGSDSSQMLKETTSQTPFLEEMVEFDQPAHKFHDAQGARKAVSLECQMKIVEQPPPEIWAVESKKPTKIVVQVEKLNGPTEDHFVVAVLVPAPRSEVSSGAIILDTLPSNVRMADDEEANVNICFSGLKVKQAGTYCIHIALHRIQGWGCVTVGVIVSNSFVVHTVTPSDIAAGY
ncbi:hypothetical protein DPSP01_013965 [Paraphaeosphaeria sporulosa]